MSASELRGYLRPDGRKGIRNVVAVAKSIGVGHKLARRGIARGEKVLKYGAIIGTASAPIARGEHIHTHNLESDYLPTYTLEAGRAFSGKHA